MTTVKPLLFIVLGVWIASVISHPELRKNPLLFAINDEVEVMLVNANASNAESVIGSAANSDYYDLIISDSDNFSEQVLQAGMFGLDSLPRRIQKAQTVEQFVTIIQNNSTATRILYFVSNQHFAYLSEELKERYRVLNEEGLEI